MTLEPLRTVEWLSIPSWIAAQLDSHQFHEVLKEGGDGVSDKLDAADTSEGKQSTLIVNLRALSRSASKFLCPELSVPPRR